MEKIIGNHDNMQLVEKIVLNGKVGYVKTEDENYETLGVINVIKKVTFKGEELVDLGSGFPLTKKMEDKIEWMHHYASVMFVTGDTPIDPTKVEETIIQSYYGEVDSAYHHRYSDCTGYLWTDEEFKVGGHDIIKILGNYVGEYIHMEIELYKESR